MGRACYQWCPVLFYYLLSCVWESIQQLEGSAPKAGLFRTLLLPVLSEICNISDAFGWRRGNSPWLLWTDLSSVYWAAAILANPNTAVHSETGSSSGIPQVSPSKLGLDVGRRISVTCTECWEARSPRILGVGSWIMIFLSLLFQGISTWQLHCKYTIDI